MERKGSRFDILGGYTPPIDAESGHRLFRPDQSLRPVRTFHKDLLIILCHLLDPGLSFTVRASALVCPDIMACMDSHGKKWFNLECPLPSTTEWDSNGVTAALMLSTSLSIMTTLVYLQISHH